MRDRYNKDFPVSWDQLHRDARALASTVRELRSWHRVIAVTRGGMVPACIVARELDIRRVDSVSIVSYDHMDQGEPQILQPVAPFPGTDPGGDLVIDDLVDTGRTFEAVRKLLPAAHYATVYAKPDGRGAVDTFVTEVSQDTWIHLPWDLELRFAEPLGQT